VPVGVVDDYQLQKGELDGYKLLFLPNPDELTIDQRREVDRFQAKGGIVIENDPRWTWSQPGETGQAIAAFRQVYSEYRDTAPVRVTGGPEKMHAVAFQNPDKNRLMVAITNDFTWIQFRKNIGKGKQSLKSPPPQIRDVEVEIKANRPPQRVVEVITGQILQPEAIRGGYKVRLPEFSPMAMLAIE